MIEIKEVSFSYSQVVPERNSEARAPVLPQAKPLTPQNNGLKDINLTIHKGEVILLCGESGCGKTTLTRLVNGLIPHFWEGNLSGDITINGNSVKDIPMYETAKMVGSVFQNPRSQFFTVDTTSELAFGSENQGLDEDVIRKRVCDTAQQFEIEPLMDRSIFELSGGEKQKIACASVSACEPDIFVLDEPSANLDAKATDDLRRMLIKWKEQGKTILIAEHRLYFLWDIADRIVFMKQGRIESIFTQQEFASLGTEKLSDMGLRALLFADIKVRSTAHNPAADDWVFSNFKFAYKKDTPVLNIDGLHVPSGACIAVIGHNGAGKTTFARCLCGLEKKCKGTMNCADKSLRRKERLKRCYMVMQDVTHQLFTESVLDEIMISMEVESEAQADEILQGLNLLDMKQLHPMALSGGEKQRVAIASAVASKREIILFDEPTSGLDLRHMQEVAANIERLTDIGKTVFVITHDPELILSCCNYVVFMERGQISESYPLDEAGVERMLQFFQNTQT